MSEPDMPPNGLKPEQLAWEGTDQFIQEYAGHGIKISMVMPQNEFNSPQPFPSCPWTAEGLARFISFLGPELQKLNVDVFFGTMERPNEKLVDTAVKTVVALVLWTY